MFRICHLAEEMTESSGSLFYIITVHSHSLHFQTVVNDGFNNRLDATYFTFLMFSERQVEKFSTLMLAVLPLEHSFIKLQ
jgi:hypothetical protein